MLLSLRLRLGFKYMNNTNDILSTDGTFGQLFAALGTSQHVATVE